MATEAKVEHTKALLQGNLDAACTCVEQLAAVDQTEAKYRFACLQFVVDVSFRFKIV